MAAAASSVTAEGLELSHGLTQSARWWWLGQGKAGPEVQILDEGGAGHGC